MRGLIVDTTIKGGYVAAFDGERREVVTLAEGISTASAILPAVREALAALSLPKEGLDGVAAVVGPGSFTGIRIGVSFVNAFAFALGIPRFRITSFDVMRECASSATAYAIDAGHDSYYTEILSDEGSEDKNITVSDLPSGTLFQRDILPNLPQGALSVLSKAIEQHVFALCAPSYLTDLLKPYYMRKSQAERMKDVHAE